MTGRTATADEFKRAQEDRPFGVRGNPSPEVVQVRALAVGEVLAFPCVHSDPRDKPACGLRIRLLAAARRVGQKVETIHQKDELLVRRTA